MANDHDPGSPWGAEQTPFVSTTPVESAVAGSTAGAASAGSAANPVNPANPERPAAFPGEPAAAGSAEGSPYGAGYGPGYSSGYGSGYGSAYPAGGAGVPPPGAWGPAGSAYAPPPPPGVGAATPPSPALAFFLGLIPGVGAMYNGQIAKGIVHLIVFSVLVTIANNVNDIFGIFVAGWIFFMAFEAFHTAKARRDGLPLPNAFGWNDIGERMGLGRNWPFSPVTGPNAAPGAAPGTAPFAAPFAAPGAGSSNPAAGAAANAAAGTTAGAPAGWSSTPPVPPVGASPYTNVPPGTGPGVGQGVAPNWAGYVPPTAFASAPPVWAAGAGVPPGQGLPYAPVNAGAPYTPQSSLSPLDLQPAASRLPVGALWLIGLGVLFLLGQWTPLLHFSRVWIPSILLAALAAFLFARRMGWTGSAAAQPYALLPPRLRVVLSLKVPAALLTIALLNGLHESGVLRWNRSWPILLIELGVLMLMERLALRQAAEFDATGNGQTGGL